MITEAVQESTFFPTHSELVAGTFCIQQLQGESAAGLFADEIKRCEIPREELQHEGPSVLVVCRQQPHQVQTPPASSEFISGYLNNNFQETNVSEHRVLALRHYELHLYPYDGNSRAAHKSELVTGK